MGWRFCSLFDDIDVFLGSLGSFFSTGLNPAALGGTFEVNPPFYPGIVEAMADKVLRALENAEASRISLQFWVFLPATAPAAVTGEHSAIDRLLESPFARGKKGGSTRPGRRCFVYGLAFRTDCPWPPFHTPARCILLRTGITNDERAAVDIASVDDGCARPRDLAKIQKIWAGILSGES